MEQSQLLFLDIEATGLDTNTAEIIEFCARTPETMIINKLFRPSKNANQFGKNNIIPFEVSGVTNITDDDVKDKKVFDPKNEELKSGYKFVAVAHNVEYDLPVLARYGINFTDSICTLKLSQYLYPQLANHKLGTLRAFFGIQVSGGAHRADYDVEILIEVYNKIANGRTMQEMILLSKEARDSLKADKLEIWQFGKFKGQKINLKNLEHRSYARWYLTQPENPQYPRDKEFVEKLKLSLI